MTSVLDIAQDGQAGLWNGVRRIESSDERPDQNERS
jgi:hypothetical protein